MCFWDKNADLEVLKYDCVDKDWPRSDQSGTNGVASQDYDFVQQLYVPSS